MDGYEEHLKKMDLKNKLKEAVELLCAELRDDPSYYISWKANIAMAFKDLITYGKISPHIYQEKDLAIYTQEQIHEIANQAADNFLKLLSGK